MAESLFVNADWSALVPAGSEEAAFGITPKDAKRRGLLPLEDGETLGEPETLMVSANLLPVAPTVTDEDGELEGEFIGSATLTVAEDGSGEISDVVGDVQLGSTEPEAKEAPKPQDKQAPKPEDKAAKKPATKGAARKDT